MARPARDALGERGAGQLPRPRRARWPLVALAILAVAALLGVLAALEGDLPEDLTSLGGFVASLVRRYGAPASLALLYVEESGVPLPVPGDVYVVYLGTVAAGSTARLLVAWVAIIAVVVAGSTNLYLISRRGAHRLVTGRLGRLLHLDPGRLARVEGWMGRWGALAIIFGRHVPGMRIPITVLAGTFEVRYRVFAPSVAVSAAIWAGTWLWLAARFGPRVQQVLTGHRLPYLAAVAVVVVLLAILVVRAWRSSGRRPATADQPRVRRVIHPAFRLVRQNQAMQRFDAYTYPQTGVRGQALGKVVGLLGVAAIFTAIGALASPALGRLGFFVGLVGAFGCLIVLNFVKERTPLNLILLFAFATLEGVLLGGILEAYLAHGLGLLVLNAASATGLVTLIAGGYGYTTKRDLTGLGSFLFIGLLVLIGASIIGLFLHLALLQIAIAAGGALLFTGFLVFDLNRVARAGQVSQGDTILLAVSVYIDIVNLFLFLLQLLGIARSND